MKVDSKENDITILPHMLKLLNIVHYTVTIDAIGYHKKTAAQIIEKKPIMCSLSKIIKKSFEQTLNKPLANALFFRQLFTLNYESFVDFSLLIVMAGLALALNRGESLQPDQGLLLTWLFIRTALFIGWFWQRVGQTLGMLACRIKVDNDDLSPLTWRTALNRFFVGTACLAAGRIGLIWCLFDKDKLALRDKLTKTRVVHLLTQKMEKRKRKKV